MGGSITNGWKRKGNHYLLVVFLLGFVQYNPFDRKTKQKGSHIQEKEQKWLIRY